MSSYLLIAFWYDLRCAGQTPPRKAFVSRSGWVISASLGILGPPLGFFFFFWATGSFASRHRLRLSQAPGRWQRLSPAR